MPANNGSSTWTATMTGTSATPWAAGATNCDSGNYVFGYYGYDSSSISNFGTAYLTYLTTNSLLASPHYGIHFRAKFLFIDDWKDGMFVTF